MKVITKRFLPLLAILQFAVLAQEPNKTQSLPTSANQKLAEQPTATPSFSTLLSQAIVFLYENKTTAPGNKAEAGQVLGTGFIVGLSPPNDLNNLIPLIVTARHVIGDQKKVLVRYTMEKGDQPGFAEYDIEEMRKAGDLWVYPNDEGVDIEIFRTQVFSGVKMIAIPLSMIATKESFQSLRVDVSDRILIPCLMANFPGSTRNYPIFRDGSIALVPDEPIAFNWQLGARRINTKQNVLLVNSTLNEGFSGAPVFLAPGTRNSPQGFQIGVEPLLLGIVHGFFPQLRNVIDARGGPVVLEQRQPGILGQINPPTQVPIFSQENPGTGIVFPSWRLLEILSSDSVKKRVQEISEEIRKTQKKPEKKM